jgi:hypothetical protein
VDYGKANRADRWELTFDSTNDSESALDTSIPRNLLTRNADVGVEMLNIGIQKASLWPDNKPVTLDAYKRIVIINTRIKKVYTNYDTFQSKMRTHGGCINSVAIFGNPKNTVMLANATATEYKNPAGQRRWVATFVFSLRAGPTGDVLGGAALTWEHLWRKETQQFELPSKETYTSNDIRGVI